MSALFGKLKLLFYLFYLELGAALGAPGLCPPCPPHRYANVRYRFLGRLKMYDLKMQDWKLTDNFARNRRVWKMQDW